MAGHTSKQGPQDSSRINVHEDYEIHYWTKRLGVSEEQLKAAVAKVDPDPGEVYDRTFDKQYVDRVRKAVVQPLKMRPSPLLPDAS